MGEGEGAAWPRRPEVLAPGRCLGFSGMLLLGADATRTGRANMDGEMYIRVPVLLRDRDGGVNVAGLCFVCCLCPTRRALGQDIGC